MTTPGRPSAILVFLKAPVPGRVKTRLARAVGDDAACDIYRRLVERQVADLPKNRPVEVHFTPTSARAEFTAWLGPRFRYVPQADGDLGSRLLHGASGAFGRGCRHILLIGGDCPSLNEGTLEEAGKRLDDGADVVIGPATDGGYYLLGLSGLFETLFEAIPWSGPEVARVTGQRAAAAGLRVSWLEEKEDLDDIDAYRRALVAGHLRV
jgi:uncharacterized protein